MVDPGNPRRFLRSAEWKKVRDDFFHGQLACRDVGLRDADDGEIWRFAIAGGWCIVTKDEDFAVRHMMAVVLLQIPVADEVVGLTYSCPNMPATMFTSQPASVPAGFPSAITRG